MHDWQSEVRARLAALRLKPEREADIVDEIAQHLAERYREATQAGASREDATRAALAEFQAGNALAQRIAALKQAHAPATVTPGASTGHLLADLVQDLRYAARAFAKKPGFAATAVLILALGLGATTAIFSLVYGVLLKPLPFPEPQALVSLRHYANFGETSQGPATYFTYRENQRSFEDIGAWDQATVAITGGGETPERVEALIVSSSTLQLLRAQPRLGRFFGTDDDVIGSAPRAILTAGYWQRRFGGAEDILGRVITIDGTPTEIIGVLPPSFEFLSTRPGVLLPMPLNPNARWISFGFNAVARLKPGVTPEQASADVEHMISLLPSIFAPLELRPNVRPLADDVTGNVADVLWILLAAVGVVLLIACGNVANLFLVRAEARHQELATRAALGASRGRLARTLLAESVALALAGGVLGVALASLGLALLRAIGPAQLPRLEEVGIDPAVLLFAAAVSIVSGVLFGMFAVARYGNPGIAMLKSGSRAASESRERNRARNAVVIGQVALALTLLIVSGLMARTLVAMLGVDPGFTLPKQVQTFVVAVPDTLIADDEQAARTHQSIAERLQQVPGVLSVGLSSSITMDGEDNGNYLTADGLPDKGLEGPQRRFKSVGPGYFETMGNPIVAGRSVEWSDVLARRHPVVISETLARELWQEPSEAIGSRVRCCGNEEWSEIVGVSGDERDDGLNRPATAIVYWAMLNDSYRWRAMAYAVRSERVGTPGFMRELEQAVWNVNPDLPLASIQTLEQIQTTSMAKTSFTLVMLVIAASVALLLGVVGIYGVISYVAAQRTREIGIRIALGAKLADVRKLFLSHGLWLTGSGIALGLVLAVVVTRVMSSYLFGVGPVDPLTYAAVSALLAAISLLAIYLPARRAARIDPNVALRADT
ncbi:MAG TPA: ABC transporter permease [Gammaproteobacteria bacterium]|nr:ABC transporter permease [Gammaproteobacteria bacterium]